MFDETKIPLMKFSASLGDDGSFNVPLDKLKLLKDSGFANVDIIIMGDSEQALKQKNIDLQLFRKIKKVQSLPETVVLEFLESKGSLCNSKLDQRIKY